ncbi:MAG: calcium/sodium antiporter [Candidatus Methanomethylophilaceae archaeon]|nr:calcium/sodium antiporter [Candidatus Methanomethylophilaceae archaeon]
MDWTLLGIPIGIVMLYLGSDWMVRGARDLAVRLGVAPFVVGLTVLAFGSSAPECVTSVVSGDTPQIIIGNVVGSNIANIGLAIGLAAVVGPLTARYRGMRLELAVMILSSVLVAVMALAGTIGTADGLVLIAAIAVFVLVVYLSRRGDAPEPVTGPEGGGMGVPMSLVAVAVGLTVLYFGAQSFIDGARELAGMFGVSDMLVGLLVVAIGTSLPEMCITVVAAYRGEADLAVSNIVGSNIFNLLFVLGVGAVLFDVPVSHSMLVFHIPVMILFSAMMFAMVRHGDVVDRPRGALLVVMYALYIVMMVVNPSLTV